MQYSTWPCWVNTRRQWKMINHFHTVDKYRRAMEWDIPESDEKEGDVLIFEAILKALDAIKGSD